MIDLIYRLGLELERTVSRMSIPALVMLGVIETALWGGLIYLIMSNN